MISHRVRNSLKVIKQQSQIKHVECRNRLVFDFNFGNAGKPKSTYIRQKLHIHVFMAQV